jgi:2-dehydro-3-deoxyphosphogluconate aldolase/(4S)-4-hydroxy-2-oxoglutarate aldolase
MARFKRLQVLNTFMETGVVPLFYHPDTEVVKKVVEAAYQGGARIFEWTNRGDYAHEVFAEVNRWAAEACPEMILGAGSVVDPATAGLYLQLGAGFIVSPSINSDIAKVCNIRKVAWIPGCATLTEIHTAEQLGCEIVKIFPGKQVGGPDFIKAVLAPSPWSSIMPTGGVAPDKENLEAWFRAGACCVGLGSKLTPKEIIDKGDYNFITQKIKEAIKTARKFK